VVGPSGDAVAVTSTINTYFGSKLMTEDGIILNNEMDDFSTPGFSNAFGFEPSPMNFVRPFKRPMSSSAPTIILNGDDDQVVFTGGASGGSRITTAVTQVALNVLSFCQSIRDAVDSPRLHHQLLPVWIYGEYAYPEDRVEYLVVRSGANAFALQRSGRQSERKTQPSLARVIGPHRPLLELHVG